MKRIICAALIVLLAGCGTVTPKKLLASANTSHMTASSAALLALDNCLAERRVNFLSPTPCIVKAEARDETLDARAEQLDTLEDIYITGGDLEITMLQQILKASEAFEALILLELTDEQREALK